MTKSVKLTISFIFPLILFSSFSYFHFYNFFVLGSIVPFSLRLIHAELPQHNGRPNVALDRLYALLEKVDQVLGHLEQGLGEDGTQWPETQDQAEIKGKYFTILRIASSVPILKQQLKSHYKSQCWKDGIFLDSAQFTCRLTQLAM